MSIYTFTKGINLYLYKAIYLKLVTAFLLLQTEVQYALGT